jgi:beta-lactamase superfamily II metal-dependent hydrolase
MNYYSYKRYFPDNVLVYVEEFNKQDGTVLFDFIDSKEYGLFNESLNSSNDLNKPSMVLLTNYKGRTVQENTIYAILPTTIQSWREQNAINSDNLNSFLIGYYIDVTKTEEPIFNESVSLSDLFDSFYLNYYMTGSGNVSNLTFHKKGKVSVTIRNVGQGNWNEINFNDKVDIVYDAGAPMNASRADIATIIGNRNTLYPTSKPVLILSHWDKDHYHSLLGMTDTELQSNFSAFVCRDRVPNRTSRILFARLRNAVGSENTYTISANTRLTRGGPTFFSPLTPKNNQVVLYNSQHHKNRNISGLALTVKTKSGSIILPGDAHYDQISRDILPHLNYRHKHNLVVPHHGGKAGAYQYNTPALAKVDKAVISVGTNRYGHPFENYITSLRTSGFTTHQTNSAAADIIVTL